jgi:hypothetical protein
MAAMSDDVDVGRIAVIGVCSTLFVYVFITFTRVIFMQQAEEQERIKNYDQTPRALVQYRDEQDKKMTGIGDAMAGTIRDEAKKQQLKSPPGPQN